MRRNVLVHLDLGVDPDRVDGILNQELAQLERYAPAVRVVPEEPAADDAG